MIYEKTPDDLSLHSPKPPLSEEKESPKVEKKSPVPVKESPISYQVIKQIDIDKIGVNRPAQSKQLIDDSDETIKIMRENARKENLRKITSLIEDVIKNLVTKPDKTKVILYQISGEGLLVRVYADKSDVGKIIGRNGSLSKAIATIGNAILKKQQRGEGNLVLDRIRSISEMEKREKKFQEDHKIG